MGVRPGRVFTGWLVLVGLYTALTNSDRLSQALGLGNSWIVALSDPTRPLIRDHGAAPAPKSTPTGDGNWTTSTGGTSGPPSPSDLFRYQSLPPALPPLSYPSPSAGIPVHK